MKLSKKEKDFYQKLDVNITITQAVHIDLVIAEIYPRLKLTKDNSRISKANLKLLLLNLYQNYMVHKNLLTGFDQNVNRYKPKSRYNKNQVSKAIIPVVKALRDQGYIGYANGNNSKVPWVESHIARIKPKLRLINIIRKHKVEANQIQKLPNTESIIVQVGQGSSKVKVDYDDTPVTNKMREDLIKYNNLLKRSHIDVNVIPEEGVIFGKSEYPIAITQKNKFIRRIFNDLEFETGGRYYGGWYQGLNSEWRNKITINLQPTIEADFSANGIKILYAIEKLEAPEGDAYDLTTVGYNNNKYSPEQLRPLLKLCLLIMINAKSYRQAFEAIKGDRNNPTKKLAQVSNSELEVILKIFADKHNGIRKYFYSSFGAHLYKYDSTVAEGVINHFTTKGVPVLCIHDSFIIELKYKEELTAVMQDSFNNTMLSNMAPSVHTQEILILNDKRKMFAIDPETRAGRQIHKNGGGLWSLIPEVIKDNTIFQYVTSTGTRTVKKEPFDQDASYERYINFVDQQKRLEDNYYK